MGQLLLLMTSVIVTLVLLEVLTPHLYRLLSGRPLPTEQLLTALNRHLDTWNDSSSRHIVDLPSHISNKAVHPYLGFVADPAQSNIDPYGFFGGGSFPENSSSTLNVALLGGSVALDSCGHFARALAVSYPREQLGGRKLSVHCLALDGYKQPQQLFTLSYFLVLGAHFDLIVNLDGFNEIALPYAENMKSGVNVFYPRSWQLFSRSLVTPGIAEKVVELQLQKSEYEWWRRRFDVPFVRWSNLALLTWKVVENKKARDIAEADRQLRDLLQQAPELPRDLGPPSQYRDLDAMFTDLARAWAESSLLMAHICKSSKIRYFHFLQPNQYVPDSKPLSEWERVNAITGGPFGDAVRKGYPLLLERGKKLAESGVSFASLTGIFSDSPDTLYSDNCCHLNEQGYRLLTEKIVSVIAESLRSEGDRGEAFSDIQAQGEGDPPRPEAPAGKL